jgi:rubrerythrin
MNDISATLHADLRTAFQAESMSVLRYIYFAQVAAIEGHQDTARLFTELAESLSCVAHGHLDFLRYVADPGTDRQIGDTAANLAAATFGELTESTNLYPRLATAAHTEGLADVASWLETLCALKRAHAARLDEALCGLTGAMAATEASGE